MPQHQQEFRALERVLKGSEGFRLIILENNDPEYRDNLIEFISREQSVVGETRLVPDDFLDFSAFEVKLAKQSEGCDIFHVVDFENYGSPDKLERFFRGFNMHRENVAEESPVALLFWMTAPIITNFALMAPDMWSWRSGVLEFSYVKDKSNNESNYDFYTEQSWLELPAEKRRERIIEIQKYLDENKSGEHDKGFFLLVDELMQLYIAQGSLPDAEITASSFLDNSESKNKEIWPIYNSLYEIYKIQGNYIKQFAVLEKMLNLSSVEQDTKKTASTILKQSIVYGWISDKKNQKRKLDAAIKIFHEEIQKNTEPDLKIISDLRYAYSMIEDQEEAKKLSEKLHLKFNKSEYKSAMKNSVMWEILREEEPDGIQEMIQLLKGMLSEENIYTKLGKNGYFQIVIRLIELLKIQKDYPDARKIAQEGAETFRKNKSDLLLQRFLVVSLELNLIIGDTSRARENIAETLELAVEHGNEISILPVYNFLASIIEEPEDRAKTLFLSWTIIKRNKLAGAVLQVAPPLALQLIEEKAYTQAREVVVTALEIFDESGHQDTGDLPLILKTIETSIEQET